MSEVGSFPTKKTSSSVCSTGKSAYLKNRSF